MKIDYNFKRNSNNTKVTLSRILNKKTEKSIVLDTELDIANFDLGLNNTDCSIFATNQVIKSYFC